MSTKPIYYMQTDPQWGNLPFTSHNDPKQTIGSSACGTTCSAMMLATLLNDQTIKPDFTAKLCVDNGYRTYNSGTDFAFYPFIAQKFGLELVESSNTDDAIWALQHGGLVICSMTPGYFTTVGHFILAWDVVDGNIIVNDPAHPSRTQASIDIFRQQCQKYFIFYKKDVVKPVSEFDGYIQILKDKGIIDSDSNHTADEVVTWEVLAKVAAKLLGK